MAKMMDIKTVSPDFHFSHSAFLIFYRVIGLENGAFDLIQRRTTMAKGISRCNNCGEEWDTLQLIEYEAKPYNKKYCIYCVEAVRTYISAVPQLRKSISALNKVISGLHSINAPDELVEKVGEPIIELSSNMNQLDILLQAIKRDAPVLYNYERESIKNGEREIHISHIPDERLDNPMRCEDGETVWSSDCL